VFGILGNVGKGPALPVSQQLAGGVFPHFPWSCGLCVTSRSSEVVSPDGWLVSSIWFLLSTGCVAIGTCGLCKVVWFVAVFPGGSCVPYSCNSVWSAPPPQQGGAIQFCLPPFVPGDLLSDPPWLCSAKLAYFLNSQLLFLAPPLLAVSLVPCFTLVLGSWFSVQSHLYCQW
jgi:hypothetical protein